MQNKTIRVHRFEDASRVNGPGLRAVLWVQGCALGCPGCFNPETHAANRGETWTVDQLVERVLSVQDGLEGLTLSGGEPLHQYPALARALKKIRKETDLTILVFSGYDWAEIQQMKGIEEFLSCVDVLIAGRYDASRRLAKGLIGSSNKTAHFLTGRYTPADLEGVPQAEVIISPDGDVILSGIDPLQW